MGGTRARDMEPMRILLEPEVRSGARIKVVVLGKGDLEYDLNQILKSYLDVNSDQQPKYRLEVQLHKAETGYAVDNYSN